MNNIEIISKFIEQLDSSNSLLINQASDEISIFYKEIIRNFSSHNNVSLKLGEETISEASNNDLFRKKLIYINETKSLKLIEKFLSSSHKSIIFTDYKNFKKFKNKTTTVNAYNYESDMKYFLLNILKIKDIKLLEYCLSTPQLLYSEISKYEVNKNDYSKDTAIKEGLSFILKIRKKIFEIKKGNNDLKRIFFYHKEEAKYKKFSFLTY